MTLRLLMAVPALALMLAPAAAQSGHSASTPHAAPAVQQLAQAQPRQAAPAFGAQMGNYFRNRAGNPVDPRSRAASPAARRAYAARPPSDKLIFGMFYRTIPRQTVAFNENHAPGTIIVRHNERRLYYVLGNGQAIRYGIAVGREGAAWSGTSTVSDKREWPSWTPTPNILRRQPDLPRFMEGGPNNPLGARALYLGQTLYRIHGTNEPWTIGDEASSGCIRMTNEDVVDLYNRTRIGARVIVQR
jgi:lipoprotein-anchoring transpeptidase ErfK/SrfK